MKSENGVQIDFEALEDVLRRADVLTIGFPLVAERLLIDLRENATDGQFAAIVEPVANVQERYQWLGRQRGSFGAPEAFSFFVWPRSVESLASPDTLRTLRSRLTNEGTRAVDEGLAEALELERRAILAAVKGDESWPALWDVHQSGDRERGQP